MGQIPCGEKGRNDLFFVGDAHQRIYGQPVIFSHCDIQIRGRARKLRINYRTTEEIRDWSMIVLKESFIDDLEGGLDEHLGYRSLMHGVPPIIEHFGNLEEEIDFLVNSILDIQKKGPIETICLVARTHNQLENDYIPALSEANIGYLYLKAETPEHVGTGVRLATMHRVKGMEFPNVIIAGVNDGILPFEHSEIDESHQSDVDQRERCLLHVASSRARDMLFVTSYGKPSRFLV